MRGIFYWPQLDWSAANVVYKTPIVLLITFFVTLRSDTQFSICTLQVQLLSLLLIKERPIFTISAEKFLEKVSELTITTCP